MTARTLLVAGLLCSVPARRVRSTRSGRSGRRQKKGTTAQQPDLAPEPRPPLRLRAGLCVTAEGRIGYHFAAATYSLTCTEI